MTLGTAINTLQILLVLDVSWAVLGLSPLPSQPELAAGHSGCRQLCQKGREGAGGAKGGNQSLQELCVPMAGQEQ